MNVVVGEESATFRAEPEHGRPVTFCVSWRKVDVSNAKSWRKKCNWRYVVHLIGSAGGGFSHHTSFEAACRSALSRARRYEKAYSRPRGVQIEQGLAS